MELPFPFFASSLFSAILFLYFSLNMENRSLLYVDFQILIVLLFISPEKI